MASIPDRSHVATGEVVRGGSPSRQAYRPGGSLSPWARRASLLPRRRAAMVVGNAGADRHARLTGVSVWVTRAAPWPLPQAQGETGACSPGHALGYRSAREVRQDLRGNPLILRGHLWRGAHRTQIELGDAERDVALQRRDTVGGGAQRGALFQVHLGESEALLHGPG